jgi:membrane-associated protease RseP (regulator of RpoE activity)
MDDPTTTPEMPADEALADPSDQPAGADEEREQRTGLRPLTAAVTAGALVVAFALNPFLAATVLALLVVIALHELGHLVVARRAGMYAPEYMVGFGPTVWSTRRGETTWGLKSIPLGGYVRIVGMTTSEEVDPELEHRAYRSRPWRWKVAVSAAGPLTNLLVAVLLITVVLMAYGKVVPSQGATVGAVAPTIDGRPSPAQVAGLRPGDEILSVGGRAVRSWDGIGESVAGVGDRSVRLVVERDGRRTTVVATPTAYEGRYVLGVSRSTERDRLGPVPAVAEAFTTLGRTTFAAVGAIGSTAARFDEYVTNLGHAEKVPQETRFLSPVGASQVARSLAQNGVADLLGLAALVNIMVGVFTLLPVPPLDGGHILVATVERVLSTLRRRPVHVPARVLAPVAYSVWALLLLIGISALWLDVVSPVRL